MKVTKLDKKQLAHISTIICQKLQGEDLGKWQETCKSLAPPNYNNTTRSRWFEENEFRVQIGRKIIAFVDEMVSTLQNDMLLQDVSTNTIRSGVVKGIREAEIKQELSHYLLNDVKLSALRTLVGWTDNPERLLGERSNVRKYGGNRRRGRKREKGKYYAPHLDLLREWELVGNDSIRMMLVVLNEYIHPYQNVEIEMDFGSNLIVTSVSPYSWVPDKNLLRIGFIEANLGVDPFEVEIIFELKMQKRQEVYKISGKVHYDNCDKGYRDQSKLHNTTLRLA